MTTTMQGLAPVRTVAPVLLIARICLASLFIWSGLEKAFDLQGAAGFAAMHGIPFARALMPLVAVFEVAAGLMLVTGWRAREAAVALGVWILVLGPWFHQFWNAPPAMWQMMVDDFFHHFVMLGGMIYLAVFGPGPWSLDRPRANSQLG